MTTIRSITSIAKRAQHTLLQDALGVAALVVMMVISLHLPSFV